MKLLNPLDAPDNSQGAVALKGQAFWLTGLSGSGKSTIAEKTLLVLKSTVPCAIHLDGDALRKGLCADLGFSTEDRAENVRRTAELAKLLVSQGATVLCSLISPLAVHRELARTILAEAFVEVYLRCDVEECIRRDPKGLYARALSGDLPGFTGVDAPYEPPTCPDLILDTQKRTPEECCATLLEKIRGDL